MIPVGVRAGARRRSGDEELCDRLPAVMLADGAEDDVAVLALRTRAAVR